MIAEVIPIVRLPKTLSYFDYEVPQEFEGQIKIGQLVKIFFKGKKVSGIIINLKDKSEQIKTKLKSIIKIVDITPVLDVNYLKLLSWLSDYYFVSPSLLLKFFIPEPPERINQFNIQSEIRPAALSVPQLFIPNIQKNLKRFFTSTKNIFVFCYQNQKNKIAFYLKSATKIIEQKKQILILEPQISDIKIILPYFLHLFPEKVAVLHKELSKIAYWQEWLKIKNGQAQIALGTRSAIFAPFNDLGLIIIDNEEMHDFKQFDQYPYYDARKTAIELSKITNAKIILASQAPRVETYYKVKKGDYEMLSEQVTPFVPPPYLIDMNQELRKKNFLSLSEELQQKIKKVLEQNKKIVLLLNRRGAATLILCRDCGYVFKCPNCGTPFTCHGGECATFFKFVCHRCGKEDAVGLTCPTCGGTSMKYFGAGTQTVEREIRKLFPQAKISRIDKDIKIQNNNKYEIQNTEIFVGTQFFVKNYLPQIQNIGLIGILSADTLLFRPDFRAGEKTFAWLTNIINYGQQIKSSILIQTFFPKNFVIQSAVTQNYEEFYKKEINEREKFNYPPFGQLINLVYGHKNEKKAVLEMLDLCKKIKRVLKNNVELLCDKKPINAKQKFFVKIILRCQVNSFKKVQRFLQTISDKWVVDIDPESII